MAPRMRGRAPQRSAAQPAGYRTAALARGPAANTTPTRADDPPRRVMKMGSSGRKNQRPIEVSRFPPYRLHRVRLSMRLRNTLAPALTNAMRQQGWDVIAAQPHPAHMHMALDEVLLESVSAGRRRPTLRLWEWIEPALVIGSHQSVINEVDVVAARELGFVVTRRMSGGGTMLCEPARTITYSLYLPDSMVAGMTFRTSYATLDDWAVRAFVELGIPASYREINDIISPRGKIGGAGQSRPPRFGLHHQTLPHPLAVASL